MCIWLIALHWHIIYEKKVLHDLLMIILRLSTWLYTKIFQTYMDQNGSFVYEERDQQSQKNVESLKDKVQSKFKTKSMCMCV